jgi:hypothetical protein
MKTIITTLTKLSSMATVDIYSANTIPYHMNVIVMT